MKKHLVFSLVAVLLLSLCNPLFAKKKKEVVFQNDMPAYMIFDSTGKKVTYAHMVNELAKHQICLFGEFHDDPISHWLEKKVTYALADLKGDSLVLGGEMWEADDQLIVDELLDGTLSKKDYTTIANNWPNFRDYKALMGVAMKNDLRFVCTNIPRRYASIIYKRGEQYLDSLPEQVYAYLPPLPVHYDLTQPAYASMLSLFADEPNPNSKNPMAHYKGANLVKAQAIKDATMAHFILKNWDEDKFFLHYNGVYHSKNHQSICYYLEYYKPGVDVVTISVSRQESALELSADNNTGDFNIVVQKDMHKTYE